MPEPRKLELEAAARLVRPRDSLLCGFVAGQPVGFLEALGARTDLVDVVLHTGLLSRPYALLKNPGVRVVSGFFGPIERMARAVGWYLLVHAGAVARVGAALAPPATLAPRRRPALGDSLRALCRPLRVDPQPFADRQLAEAIRNACVDAALAGYDDAAISGLCHEGAWEAALSAIRRLDLDALAEAAVSAGPPLAIDQAAADTGAIAAALLERAAAVSALRGPEGFRRRARSIASRAATLQSTLSPALHAAGTDSVLDVGARCAQLATLAAEVAKDGLEEVRQDAAAALRLAASAAECAIALTQENLRSVVESDSTRSTQRRIWRTRLMLRRACPAAINGSE